MGCRFLENTKSVLILGIGNVLLGDEGVGVHAINRLRQEKLPEFVELLDGGTGGFHLLAYIEGYSTIIMVDATMDGKSAGSLTLLEPKFARDYPKTLTAHDIGLKDLIESAAILGHSPKVYLIAVTVDSIGKPTMELSEKVNQSIPKILESIGTILDQL